MENEIKEQEIKTEEEIIKKEKNYMLPLSIFITGAMLAGAIVYTATLWSQGGFQNSNRTPEQKAMLQLEEKVLPEKGVALPVVWGDLGKQLVESGAIDGERFKKLYNDRGQFTPEYEQLLSGENNKEIKITKDKAGYLLNIFWALGLANKNSILETGEMSDPKYGGAGNFASTGGWTMARSTSSGQAQGDAMEHYSKHVFFTLTPEQQALVDKVSRGIYRPCCGNSVHFPDCNHGMAMLGLLELMASQGATEQEMWDIALVVNSYWFPDTYLTIATFMKNKGVEWKDVNPEEMLGKEYSSSQGYANVRSQVVVPASGQNSGGGCGVDTGAPASAPAPRQQSGCGV